MRLSVPNADTLNETTRTKNHFMNVKRCRGENMAEDVTLKFILGFRNRIS